MPILTFLIFNVKTFKLKLKSYLIIKNFNYFKNKFKSLKTSNKLLSVFDILFTIFSIYILIKKTKSIAMNIQLC